MADGKDLLVRIDAETTGYERAIARAEAQTKSFEYSLRQANAEAKSQEQALLAQSQATERLGRGMLIAGGVVAAGLGLMAKAAIDWESQWTSVVKVLDGTPEQLDAVEQGIRSLALELPTSQEELAKIAASAGALGIATPNVVEFTKTIAMLGETTNLVGDDGATTLARFLNIMGTSQGEIDNVAASLVALGNNGASTESEIAALALRLAAAGRNSGLAEGEVLGLANAMSSLGIEAESGGTAMSLTFQMIDKAVKSGGTELAKFADVAGVSASKFATIYGDDAAAALTKFLDGLGRIKDSGGNVYQVLNDLGISGQRQIDTLTRLAGAGDLVSESLKLGADEYERNMALTDEFAKRNATTAAELERARNAANEFAIQLGETLLPIIGEVASDLSGMLRFLGDLPEPIKEIGVIAAAAAAGIALMGGAALIAQVKLARLRAEMAQYNAAGSGMSKGMIAARAGVGGLGIGLLALSSQLGDTNKAVNEFANVAGGAAIGFAAGGPWGAAIGAGIGFLTTFSQANASAAEKVRILTESLDEQTGATTDATEALVNRELLDSGALQYAKDLGLNLALVKDAAVGADGAVADLYRAGSGLNLEAGDEDYQKLVALYGIVQDQQGPLGEALANWRLLSEAEGDAADASGDAAGGLAGVGDAADSAATDVAQLEDAFEDLNAELSKRSSARGYEAAIDDATAALKENGRTLNNNTEAGRANADALDAIASSALDHAQAVVKDTGNLAAGRKVLQGARDDLYDQARAFGMSKDRAREYVDAVLKIPTEWKTDVKLDTERAKSAAQILKSYIENLDPVVQATIALNYDKGRGFKASADGGLVTGPGGPRDDKAGLYALSNREFVQSAAAVDYYGVGFMEALNQRRVPKGAMADGGTPGGSQPVFTLARLLHMLGRPEDFTSIREVNDLIAARNREERQLSAALKEQAQARKAVKEAEGDRAKAAAAKELEKAEKAVADQREDLADATTKWKDAQAALLAQTQAFAATASGQGDAFGGEGTSLTAQGLLAKKRAAGTAAKEFEAYLRVLRRKNLDDDILLEIRSEGPTPEGIALAKSLAESSQRQIRQINRADDRLDRQARNVATFGTGGVGGRGRDAPVVNIERMYAADPDKAAKAIAKQQRRALAMARNR